MRAPCGDEIHLLAANWPTGGMLAEQWDTIKPEQREAIHRFLAELGIDLDAETAPQDPASGPSVPPPIIAGPYQHHDNVRDNVRGRPAAAGPPGENPVTGGSESAAIPAGLTVGATPTASKPETASSGGPENPRSEEPGGGACDTGPGRPAAVIHTREAVEAAFDAIYEESNCEDFECDGCGYQHINLDGDTDMSFDKQYVAAQRQTLGEGETILRPAPCDLPSSDETPNAQQAPDGEPGLTPGWVAPPSNLGRFAHGAGHYDRGGISVMDVIEAKLGAVGRNDEELGGEDYYFWANAIKYILRWPFKGTPKKDLEKVRDYVEKLLEGLD